MKPPLRALSAGVIAAGLAVCAVSPALAAPPTPPSIATPVGQSHTPGASHTVTLITGDVVTLREGASGNTATVRTADGRPATARIIESNGDLYVYPESAIAYVAAGSLDKALFNVSQLVADGYDDAHRPELPLIVTYADGASSRRADAVPAGAKRVQALSSIDGASVAESRATSAQFWAGITAGNDTSRSANPALAAGIEKIWLDGKVHALLSDSTKQIGADTVWADGNTGQGVTVAVLDTGIDPTHPDFAGKIADSASFVPGEDITDTHGHGTHVASTIAGIGAASDGKERGVAPGAMLDVGKVLNSTGYGEDSWIIAGMEWAARDERAKIISISIGGGTSDGTDPMSQAVDRLSAETGSLFVVAAGNAGSPISVTTPGAADAALTVAAVDGSDALADFSSRGPRLGDHLIKPEISAPGVDILAAHSQFAEPVSTGMYRTLSGTSMATPHVAGSAALLLHEHPELTGPQLKDALISTSKPTPAYSVFEAGNGRVDDVAATAATVIGTGTITVSRDAASKAGVVTQPVTYTNLGDAAVSLKLAVSGTAPAGLFALSAKTVTVAPHSSSAVTLTTTLSKGTDTDALASITAAVGSKTVARTALALPPVTHTLTFAMTDQNGAPGSGTVELLTDGPDGFTLIAVNGTTTVRLKPGQYSAVARGTVRGVHGDSSIGAALITAPNIDLSKDTTVKLDFSAVRQVQTTVPKTTRDTFQRLDNYRKLGANDARSVEVGGSDADSLWTTPTGKATHGEFDLTARWRKEQPEFILSTSKHDYTDVARELGTTRLPDGTSSLALVFAGTGTPAEYSGLATKGKAVVVRHSPSTIAYSDQAKAAVAAGAKLLIVASDIPGVPADLYGVGGATPVDPIEVTPIEVVGVSTDEGEQLIAEAKKKGAKASITSTLKSTYVYDVVQSYQGQIPQNLVKHEDAATLARITENFSAASTAPAGVGEVRYDYEPYADWGVGLVSPRPLAAKRTDWVSVGDTWQWGQEAYIAGDSYEYAPRGQYAAGSLNADSWFAPVTRPYLNNAYHAPQRSGDYINIDLPGFGSGTHVGIGQSDQQVQTSSLYQGSTLLSTNQGSYADASGLSSASLPYRFVTKTTQSPELGDLSPSTSTQWNFTSAAPADGVSAVLPLTQLGYTISANAKGVVKNESTVTITPQKLTGAVGSGTLGKPTVALSYDDGKTWRSVTVTKGTGGSWQVTVEALLHTKYVSIRTDLADTKGNSVSQTVIRAFGVK